MFIYIQNTKKHQEPIWINLTLTKERTELSAIPSSCNTCTQSIGLILFWRWISKVNEIKCEFFLATIRRVSKFLWWMWYRPKGNLAKVEFAFLKMSKWSSWIHSFTNIKILLWNSQKNKMSNKLFVCLKGMYICHCWNDIQMQCHNNFRSIRIAWVCCRDRCRFEQHHQLAKVFFQVHKQNFSCSIQHLHQSKKKFVESNGRHRKW